MEDSRSVPEASQKKGGWAQPDPRFFMGKTVRGGLPMAEREDKELIGIIGRGRDAQAAECLFRRYEKKAFSLAIKITGHRNTAEEAVQEAMLKVWKAAPQFRGENGAGWIMRIVAHESITMAHRYGGIRTGSRSMRQEEKPGHDPDTLVRMERPEQAPDALVRMEKEERHAALRGFVEELSPPDQRLLALCFGGGLSHEEIAKALTMPKSTVSYRINRSLLRLREMLEKSGWMGMGTWNLEEILGPVFFSGSSPLPDFHDRVSRFVFSNSSESKPKGLPGLFSRRGLAWIGGGLLLLVTALAGYFSLKPSFDPPDGALGLGGQVLPGKAQVWFLVKEVRGRVERKGPEGERSQNGGLSGDVQGSWLPLAAGFRLGAGEWVQTGDDGEVRLEDGDGWELLMREDSRAEFFPGPAETLFFSGGCLVGQGRASKSQLRLSTPHASLELPSGRFLLTVPSGFSRVDVIEGQAGWEDRRSGGRVDVPAGSFAAAGKDAQGALLAPQVRPSFGRELSSRFGGLYYREFAQMYRTGKYALQGSPDAGRVLRAWDARELFLRASNLEQERPRNELLKTDGREWLAMQNDHQDLKKVSWNLDWPAAEGGMLEIEFLVSDKPSREFKFYFELLGVNIIHLKDSIHPFNSGEPRVSANDKPSPWVKDFSKIFIKYFQVGETPDGHPVHEVECRYLTLAKKRGWNFGRPVGFSFKWGGITLRMTRVVLREIGPLPGMTR